MVGLLGLIWQEFEFSLLNIDGLCESFIFLVMKGFVGFWLFSGKIGTFCGKSVVNTGSSQ